MTEEFRDLGRDKLENGQAGGGELRRTRIAEKLWIITLTLVQMLKVKREGGCDTRLIRCLLTKIVLFNCITVTVTFQNVLQAVHKIDVRNVTHNYEHVTPNELTLVRDMLSH